MKNKSKIDSKLDRMFPGYSEGIKMNVDSAVKLISLNTIYTIPGVTLYELKQSHDILDNPTKHHDLNDTLARLVRKCQVSIRNMTTVEDRRESRFQYDNQCNILYTKLLKKLDKIEKDKVW